MCNYRIESQVSGLRGEVVFLGAIIAGALLLNAYILLQMADDLHYLKEVEKEKAKLPIPPGEFEVKETAETATEQPASTTEEKPVEETKIESENKTDEKQ